MPRATHIDIAILMANPSLLPDEPLRAKLADDIRPAVNAAVKTCLRAIQKAQKSPTETRRWALDGLPYTAHFDVVHEKACREAHVDQTSPSGLAVGNAIYRTLVNTRKKGLLFKAAATAVRKPKAKPKKAPARRVSPTLRRKKVKTRA